MCCVSVKRWLPGTERSKIVADLDEEERKDRYQELWHIPRNAAVITVGR